MRILLTGAAGLIGTAIAARLRQNHKVVGLDVRPGPAVQIVSDCHDISEWRGKIGPVAAVVHTAALHAPHVGACTEADFRRNNIDATARLVDLAIDAGAKSFVLTSTTSLYGRALECAERAVWVDEKLQPEPRDIYDETKLAAEQLVSSASSQMTVTSLRMSRCFPEAMELMAGYRLYRGIDRRDVAEAHALAIGRKGPAAVYVISAATPFLRTDCEELLTDAPMVIERRCPGLVVRMAAKGWQPPRSIDRVYSPGLATTDLGFHPRHGIQSCLSGDWDPLPSH